MTALGKATNSGCRCHLSTVIYQLLNPITDNRREHHYAEEFYMCGNIICIIHKALQTKMPMYFGCITRSLVNNSLKAAFSIG
jgi:hypothetical protein